MDRPWIENAITPDKPVIFLDTDGLSCSWHGPEGSTFKGLELSGIGMDAGGPINHFEVLIAQRAILALTLCGLDASSIGLITPFRSQVSSFLV